MKQLKLAAGLVLATGLSACATVGPDYQPPKVTDLAPENFSYGQRYSEEQPLANWWLSFNDPVLTELVAQGMQQNRSLQAAAASVQAARAEFGLARSQRLPTDSVEGLAQETRGSNAVIPGSVGKQPEIDLRSLGVAAGWEIDLFGRVSRTIEVANAQLGAADANLADLKMVIAADIVDTYLSFRGAQAQLSVANANADAQRETLELTETVRDAGQGTDLDVQRARAQLETTLATVPSLKFQTEAALSRLALLTGQRLDHIVTDLEGVKDVPTLAEDIAVGSPEALLRRRPDIAQAERQLAAATANIGLTVAEAFPKLSFLGSISISSDGSEEFGDSRSVGYAVGPALNWSLTNLFRAKHRTAAAGERANAAFANYEQAVLAALSETETAMAQLNRSQQQAQRLMAAEKASSEAARIARLRYEQGATSFLEVLDSELRALTAADAKVGSITAVSRAQVQLFRVLRAGVAPAAE